MLAVAVVQGQVVGAREQPGGDRGSDGIRTEHNDIFQPGITQADARCAAEAGAGDGDLIRAGRQQSQDPG